MRRFRAPLALALVLLTSACTESKAWQSEHGHDHPLTGSIWDVANVAFLSEAQLIDHLAAARFVLLGETHDNPDHHVLQARVIDALVRTGKRPAVGLEMLDVEQSEALEAHLARAPRDAAGLGDAVGWNQSGWPDWAMYQPIADAALAADLPLFTANLSRADVRKLATEGTDGLDPALVTRLNLQEPLPEAERAILSSEIEAAHCGYSTPEMVDGMVLGQRARDAHMADATRSNASPDGAVLIAGTGHARTDLGVPYYIRRLDAAAGILSVALIEVITGLETPEAYAEHYRRAKLPFDYVWFTPRVDIRDPCERFEEQLQQMKSQRTATD